MFIQVMLNLKFSFRPQRSSSFEDKAILLKKV